MFKIIQQLGPNGQFLPVFTLIRFMNVKGIRQEIWRVENISAVDIFKALPPRSVLGKKTWH